MSAIAYNNDPNTKPSRLSRRRKKKWRNSKLTSMLNAAMLSTHSQKTSAGRGNPFSSGDKTPQPLAAFLCLPFSAALNRDYSVMAGLFRQRSALAAPLGGFPPCLSPPPDTVESIRGGLFLTSGVTAMKNPIQHAQTAQNHPKTQEKAVNSFLEQIHALEIERETVLTAGLPALQRLANIAKGDTGQAGTVRRFLLGLYNGHRWPFDLTTLRGLDRDLFDDCMALLRLDARATIKEVHQYFTNGSALFAKFVKMEG
ncbi:hypothetical protein [Methylotuvimicrobium sp. KM1]|uniref:DUF7673 family protein n=1 Tax=Methylotuvimicrobium sp. KM1 TaxID=3377707 RepID=UPI003850797A